MEEKPKTFEQVSNKLEFEDKDLTGVHVETQVYLPGLISEDGKATIKELVFLAVLKSWTAASQLTGEDAEQKLKDMLRSDDDPINKVIDEDVPELFARAARIEALEALQYFCEHKEETLKKFSDLLGKDFANG